MRFFHSPFVLAVFALLLGCTSEAPSPSSRSEGSPPQTSTQASGQTADQTAAQTSAPTPEPTAEPAYLDAGGFSERFNRFIAAIGRAPTDSLYLRKEYGVHIRNLPLESLRIARNTVFARRGYRFQAADLQRYFGAHPWYTPSTDSVTLSPDEESFLQRVQDAEVLLREKHALPDSMEDALLARLDSATAVQAAVQLRDSSWTAPIWFVSLTAKPYPDSLTETARAACDGIENCTPMKAEYRGTRWVEAVQQRDSKLRRIPFDFPRRDDLFLYPPGVDGTLSVLPSNSNQVVLNEIGWGAEDPERPFRVRALFASEPFPVIPRTNRALSPGNRC